MHFFIAGDSGGISPAALLEPSWKYDERRIHIWKQDVTFITDKVDVGICTLCLWASSCLTLCTIIIQTYHAVIGSARAGQADLVLRERLWLCKAWTWKSCGILPGWGSRKDWLVHVCFLLWKDQCRLNYSFSPRKAEWEGRRWLGMSRQWHLTLGRHIQKWKKYVLPDIPQPFPFFLPLVWGYTRDVANATSLVVFFFF